MLDGCPHRRIVMYYLNSLFLSLISVRLVYLTVIKGVGELRYNTLTKQEVMHVFLWV